MTQIARSLTDLIGHTPLLELSGTESELKLKARVIAKLEYLNPGRSVKDRTALAMIERAESKGLLGANTTIIEPTSGNTGIGLALVAAIRGYRLVLTMPDSMSVERRTLLKALGAELVLTGVGQLLRQLGGKVKVIGVEPYSSSVLSGERPGPHKIQGIGAGFLPRILDTTIYDEILRIKDDEAFAVGRLLATKDGLLTGISSGAAAAAAIKLARRPENEGKTIVVLLPDTGERYLSTQLFHFGE